MKYKDLSHLSNDKVEEIINRYFDGENVKSILGEIDLNLNPSFLYKLFPPVVSNSQKCPYCEVYLIANYNSRSSTSKISYWFCPNCFHKINNENCSCENCLVIKEENLSKQLVIKRNTFIDFIDSLNPKVPINYATINIEDKILLAALLRANLSENLNYIAALNQKHEKLSPSINYDIEIIMQLRKHNILCISEYTDINFFSMGDNEESKTLAYYDACYKLNLVDFNGGYYTDSTIRDLLYIEDMKIRVDDVEYLFNLWKKISFEESLEYLLLNVNKFNLNFNPGEKTNENLQHLVNNFSTGQIYNLIYRAVKDAAALVQANEIPHRQAVNTIPGSLLRYGERALINNWDIKSFNRDFNCAQGILSEVFYRNILKIDDGFNLIPNLEYIKKLILK